MAMLLLAECAPRTEDILVYGAGSGLELMAFANAQPDWWLCGIDPSAEMLDLARKTLGPLQECVDLLQGYFADAPFGPFDGATCLLTLHFLTREERLEVLQEIRCCLRPGARLVVAHHSFSSGDDPKPWMMRSILFADRNAHDREKASASAEIMVERLPLLSSDDEQALLDQAGFSDVALFYAAFSFRGWIATA